MRWHLAAGVVVLMCCALPVVAGGRRLDGANTQERVITKEKATETAAAVMVRLPSNATIDAAFSKPQADIVKQLRDALQKIADERAWIGTNKVAGNFKATVEASEMRPGAGR